MDTSKTLGRESVFCVFCKTGREPAVESFLTLRAYRVISSFTAQKVFRNGKAQTERRPILPGYVFFAAPAPPDWKTILASSDIYYPVAYADGTNTLRNNDLAFVKWLLLHTGSSNGAPAGTIGVSQVMKIGTRIKVVNGPLKDFEGSITKVNKARKIAAIELSTDSMFHIVWVPIEYVEKQKNCEISPKTT
jgi:transcription antitermination factor NusG